MTIKIALRLVRATHGGVVLAQRAVRTYTQYAFYSLRDRKDRQTYNCTLSQVDGPRHSLMYHNVEDFFLSQLDNKNIFGYRITARAWHGLPSSYYYLQWSENPMPYAIYRTLVAAYFFLMVFYTALYGTIGVKMVIMLTYWSYYLLVASQILRTVNCWHYIALRKQHKDMHIYLRNKRRMKAQWLLENLSHDAAPLVSVLFWTIAYDGSGVTFINCTTHGLNAAVVLLDTFISRAPVRMLHLYQISCLGIVYTVFTYLYHICGGTNHKGEPFIYKPMDYSASIKVALSTSVVSIFFAAPLIHCLIFFLYRFRLFIYHYLKAMEKRADGVKTQKTTSN